MASDEIGVEMREEDVFDLEFVLGGEGEVLVNIALRVNDGGGGGLLVADEIRGVRQTSKIKLLENHGAPLLAAARYLGCGTIRI
jgi:hypothetical protein